MATLCVSNKENIEVMDVDPDSSTKQQLNKKTTASVNEVHDEMQYLELIEKIIKTGKVKGDRTGNSVLVGHKNKKRLVLNKYYDRDQPKTFKTNIV